MHSDWDHFVKSSRTPLFMFERTFMEYHSHRFEDYSLVLRDDKGIIALLPANRVNDELISHGGLTYGGLIFAKKCSAEKMVDLVGVMLSTIKSWGIRKIKYKTIPYIFQEQPSDETVYALSRHGAHLFGRDLSSIIKLENRLEYSTLRKRQIKKALKANVQIVDSDDYASAHLMLRSTLAKHGTQPVHNLEELEYLKSKFPKNIQLRVAKIDNDIVAALVLFIFKSVVHTQYISVSLEGGKVGALDLLIAQTVDNFQELNFKFFSFGISTESNGKVLNKGLIQQKEGFGGRGMALDTYRLYLNG